MVFEKKTWVDEDTATDTDPRLEAAELNRLENGIANAYSLGNASDGTPYIQNEYGTIVLPNESDILALDRANIYYAPDATNGPYNGDFIVEVFTTNDINYRKVVIKDISKEITYENTLTNGIWSGWMLDSGDTGWITPDGFTVTQIQYRRKNGWVQIHMQLSLATATSFTNLFTLPVGFRPSRSIYGMLSHNSAAAQYQSNIAVGASGAVQYINNTEASSFIGNIPFPVD